MGEVQELAHDEGTVMPTASGVPVQSRVFAVIPVFNRLHFTRACVSQLLGQSHALLDIVVVDGGSSDGTVEALRAEFPQACVIASEQEVWWAGAMQLGIEHALASSSSELDFVLMMNDDTEFDHDFVERLVELASVTHAAVGSLIVDSRDPEKILDAGEFIEWESYTFPVKTEVASGERYCDTVDVLPGRGTLVPLSMIRVAGNVDAARFPHYIADYEFFCRLRRHGFRLFVSYEVRLRAHIEETGLNVAEQDLSYREIWRLFTSRRSMINVFDHWQFVGRCAPAARVWPLRVSMVLRTLSILDHRPEVRRVLRALRIVKYWVVRPTRKLLVSPYYVTAADLGRCGVGSEALALGCSERIIEEWEGLGIYVFVRRRREWWDEYPQFRKLWRMAWNPLTKPWRWLALRRRRRAV